MLNLAGEDGPVIELSSTQEGSFAESLAQARRGEVPQDWVYVHRFDDADRPKAMALPPGRRGEFASEEDVSSVWARHGL